MTKMSKLLCVCLLLASCAPTPTSKRTSKRAAERKSVTNHAPAMCLGLTARLEMPMLRLAASLDKEPIRRAFRRREPGFRCCYAQQRGRDIEATGKAIVGLDFVRGQITASSIEVDGSLDRYMATCVDRVAQEIAIPEWRAMSKPDIVRSELRKLGRNSPPDPRRASRDDFRVRIRYPMLFVSD